MVHHVDIGGLAAGGMPTYATEVYAEGLRLPLLRLYDRGQLNETLIDIIRKNVLIPDLVSWRSDGRGRRRLSCWATAAREDRERTRDTHFRAASAKLLDYSETLCRRMIAAWPDGVYRFEDVVDDTPMGRWP